MAGRKNQFNLSDKQIEAAAKTGREKTQKAYAEKADIIAKGYPTSSKKTGASVSSNTGKKNQFSGKRTTGDGATRVDQVMAAAINSTLSAFQKLAADNTSSTGSLSMGESARAAINEAKTAKKEGRQVRPGQAQRKAEQDKIKSFNDGWAGDFKQKLLEGAQKSAESAYESERHAKEGLGKFGQGVVDFGIAGAQFAGDALLNAVAPGAGLAAMAGRAYGSASLDAQQRGLSEGEQQISGLKSAAIEMLTEKLFGSVSKVAYGKGIIRNESLVNSLVNRLAKTDRGRTALKVLVGANEEGMEEVLSDILNPIADRILKLDDGKGDWSDLADDYDTQQMLEDYIIGGALGLVGAGTNVVSGQYRAENAQQRAYEEYQRQLVNAGLATEQGGDAQITAEKYKNILDQSTQRGKRNLSDKETANLESLIRGTYAQEDASDVSTRLAQLGTGASEQTVNAIVKAVNGETLSRAEQKAFDANPYSQRVVNEMLDTEGVTSNEWYADRASAQSFTPEVSNGINIEQAQNVLDTSTANNLKFVNSMARQYEVAPEVVERTYNLNPTAPQAFETAFNAVYQMGQQGTDKAALGKVPVLSTAQANIAYQMGADSVMSTETTAPVTNNNTQEVNDNGVRIHNVAERINGQNTEGQIRGVETGTGENVAGGSQKEQGGAGAAQIKAGEKVSYKGKQQKGVYYAAEDTDDMKKGRKLAESYGYKVTYFVGGNIRYAGGEFRGVVDTAKKTVMVRADHPDYTAEQIMRHEMGHAAFENGDLRIDEAREMLLDEFTADEINELIEIYNSEYGGILSAEEAFEEICCDALGRMNIFEGTDLNSESYGKAQDTVRKYAAERTGNKGRAPPKKGGEKYSREVNGKKIAWIENNPLSLKDLTNYKKVAAYIADHIGEVYTILESGSKVYIGENLPSEYTQSEYTKRILKNVPPILKAKNKAIGRFGEMIEIATNRRWEKAKHTANKDAKYGVYRYSTAFAFPVNQNGKVVNVKSFDAELIILNSSDGKKYLYDIVNIKENTADEVDLLKRDQMRQNASARRGVSENSIRSSSENVNEKFSLEPVSDSAYMEAVERGDIEKAQRMVDEAALKWGAMKNGYDGSYYFYHGTNSDNFNVFDKSYIGAANDSGFFGKGFYFAYSRGEASYYGRNVKKAYLRITKPFDFQQEMYMLDGKRSPGRADIAFIVNFANKFPELAEKHSVSYVEKGSDNVKTMPYAEFSELFMKYYNSVDFKVEKLENTDNEFAVLADKYTQTYEGADGKKHKFTDYKFNQRVYGQDAANDKVMLTMKYIEKVVFDYVDTGTSNIGGVASVIMESPEFSSKLRKLGYDGVIQSKDGDEAVVFDSEQIKAADPITYDDNGNIIPLSKRFDSENEDIRYSREPERLNELRRQNEELKQRVEYWRNQTKPTTTKTVRKGDVQKLAREVIDMSDTDLKPGDITEGLSKLGEYILNEPELRYTDVAEMANSIASEVVENATAIVNEDDVEIHNDLKDYLKRVKFRDDGSTEFASVRRNYKRRIMFDNNGLGVDVAYAELQNMFGEGYFPEDIINPGDMLERIAEVLDGTAPKYGNPNSYYSKEATEFLRNYIIDSMLGDQVRQTAPTYADKANAKLAETKADYNQRLRKQREEFNEKTTSIKEQNKQRVKEAISKERQRGEHRLQKFRDSVKERDTKRKETAEKSRYKKQIEKNVKTLSDWLLKPDHKNALKHIPGELQSTVRDFIASINFASARQLGGGAATQKDMRYLSNLERLHRYITDSNVGEDRYSGYLDLPPNFDVELGNFIHEVNALARKNSGYTINDMTVEQLKELSDIVKTMKKTITDMNRMYQNKTFQHAYDAGAADVETLKGYVKTKAFTSNLATNRLDQTVMWEQSRPAHVFKRFGKGGESIYHEFADGQGTMAFLTKEVIDFSAETYKSEEVKAWAKETHTFEFGGDKVTLTTAQLMSLYELNKRTQAKQHIDSGGFRVANFKNGHFNLKTDKNSHRFTDIELGEMFSKLTDRQKEVADKLQRFMVEKGGAWGNYVSIKRFDVEMFKDENYFPIKVDDGQLDAKESESVDNASLYQLLNMGFAKDVSAKANQALVVYDIFDVFANHMAEMAQYRSFALPVLDAMKWFNYKERNESGAVTASLREEMRRAFGSDVNGRGFAEKFITGVIKAYNGAEGRGDNSLNSKMLNRVNRSAVAYNTRVMIQQPSAIVRAAMFLNPSDLAASLKNYVGITTKANIEEMHKYSGLAVWKDLGFYDVNVSRGVQELIKHSQGAVSKINEFGMKGAELADKVTWAALWDASKRKVSRETGLNKNDAEFFPKVVELFEDTVYNTQVVDTVLTKSELTRNKSFGVRLFTSFMSEPMTTASLVTSEIFDIQMKQAAGQKLGLSDYKRLSKTCVVVMLAAIVNSALAALADAWRDDDDYGTFGEKWTRALQVKLADELMPLTYFPFVSNVWDITKILLDDADKKWFGVAVYGNGTDIPLTDIVSSAEKALEIFQEIDEKGDKARYTKFGGYYKIVNILSKITGVPFYNATREIVTLHNILLPSDKWRSYEPKPENAIQFAWRDGYLTDEEALEYLQDEEIMGSEVLDEGKAWFALNKWKTGDTSDYTKLYEELDKSGDIKGAVDELREHGKEDGNIKGRVTDHFKDAYINGSSEEREKIRRAMYATGLYGSVNEVIEKCNDWLKKTK